jgi:MarR family transcriptional regulator, 2-MHQ and catechol-resistance regulon repressor
MTSGAHIRLVLWKAARAVTRIDQLSIKETGLGLSDFSIMEALMHKGPLQIGEIGGKVLLTSGSMTAAINRLEKIGYVKRMKDTEDGRCYYVALTKSGQKVIEAAYAKHERNLEKVVAVLSSDEKAELVALLKKIGFHASSMAPA